MTLHNIVNVFNATSTLKNDYIVNFMLCVCFNNKITKKTKEKLQEVRALSFLYCVHALKTLNKYLLNKSRKNGFSDRICVPF